MGRKARETPPPAPAPAPAKPDRKPLLAACAILVVATFAVFARLGTQEFINYDDPDYVTANAMVRNGVTGEGIGWAFTHFHSSNWHPLTWISHMIDVQLFGMNAGAHKLVNVAFHAAAAVLLLLFLFRATGALWPSAVVAALFALHPTRVESVAWVSERKDVLSAFFWMLTLYLYAGYVQSGKRAKLIWVTVAFACALMSKPSAITLPFVLLLLDWWPFKRFGVRQHAAAFESGGKPPHSIILEKLPLFALLIPSILLTLRAQTAAIGQVSFGGRVANAILSYADYLRMLVWPSGLAILYPYRASISSVTVVFALVVLLGITALAVVYARRAPYVIVGWLWFLGTLVPMSGLVQVGRQAMADRYTYLSYVGLFIAIVWALWTFAQKYAREVAIAAVALFGVVTFVQAGYWKDSETLFGHALDVTKGNDIAHLSIGAAMLERGEAQKALEHLRKAVEVDPRNPLAQNNLGRALAATGDAAGAERAYRQAMTLDPNLAEVYRNLADLKMRGGHTEEATALLQKANSMKADTATRAELAAVRGDVDAALTEYAAAVREAPENAEIRNGYAAMLARKGRDSEALAEYLEALRINPGHYDANMNLGALMSRMGRDAEATQHFQKAAEVQPNALEPHIYLALIYGNGGDPARAVQEVEAAARIDQAEANRVFTNAVRIPFKENNLAEYRAALLAQSGNR